MPELPDLTVYLEHLAERIANRRLLRVRLPNPFLNETNYCARCQTGGKIHADRALSRLLKKNWPRSLEELA